MASDRDRLLAIFGEELADRRRDLERGLLGLEGDPGPELRTELVAELFRAAHSLKGAAHSAGVTRIAEAAHGLEELFAQLRDSGQPPDPQQLRAALAVIDELEELADQLRPDGRAGPDTETSGGARADRQRPVTLRESRGGGNGQVRARVASEDLDAAMTAAGELHLQVSGITQLSGSISTVASHARRLEREWQELRASPGHAPTEHTSATVARRFDTELQHLTASAIEVERRASEREHRLARAAQDVERAVQRLGLVQFEDVCAGLDRAARDVASTAGKQARLEVDAGTLELDRTVAAVLRDPLVHLVRNAVDHGLEEPDVRTRAGKPPEGRIAVTAVLHAGELVVTVSDDGAGIDVAAIRQAANRRGLDAPADHEQVVQLLFAPGLSTRSTTTDVSGRGVGLDAVRTSVEAVGGSVEIQTGADTGMAVRMRLPLTLSTMRAVVVRCEGEVVALPAAAVARASRLAREAVTDAGGRPMVVIDDRSVAVADLGEVLGFGPASDPANGGLLVIVVRTADGEAAMIVDELIEEQEVWVRPLPGRLRGLRGLLGGAVLGDGRCVLLLSPATWVRAAQQRDRSTAQPPPRTVPDRARILLAEDTATTRMLEQSILEAAGYEVLVAADGHEAWRRLQQHGADLIVTDVDMPGMDGFELCSRIRSSPQFGHLPVVLVTSLADDRDHARGLDVGADAYFVKSSFDQTSLIDTIGRLL